MQKSEKFIILRKMMTADILPEFKDVFMKSNRVSSKSLYFNFFSISWKIRLFTIRSIKKRKKVNEDRKIALFEEEKHNQNSELQKEIEKLNSQIQEYKFLAVERKNMTMDRLNKLLDEGALDSNY